MRGGRESTQSRGSLPSPVMVNTATELVSLVSSRSGEGQVVYCPRPLSSVLAVSK